jgi:hypothetical protein
MPRGGCLLAVTLYGSDRVVEHYHARGQRIGRFGALLKQEVLRAPETSEYRRSRQPRR